MLARIGASCIGLGLALASSVHAAGSERIRLNQVGYGLGQSKLAVLLNDDSVATLVDSATGTEVYRAATSPRVRWSAAGDTARLFDFSSVNTPGTYKVQAGTQLSHPVRISANPFQDVSKASIKAFWYNRSSYELKAPWAGKWLRAAGHPDTAVLIHASAASAGRPKGSTIRSPGGWYDAGDYGKYVVNSGISTWTLLHLYENTLPTMDTVHLNVPDHGAGSDLLDEVLWNLRWMLSMQDPGDGGVYHKLTTANFDAFEMPVANKAPRFVFQKSTAAALDLAAVSAYASRLLKDKPEFKAFADSCRSAAVLAWNWARANPEAYFDQSALNAKFYDPVSFASDSVFTGDYGDGDVTDEFLWAGAELFLTTGIDSFATASGLSAKAKSLTQISTPYWGEVSGLAWLTLVGRDSAMTGAMTGTMAAIKAAVLKTANGNLSYRKANGYRIPQGSADWGSNSVYANNGIILWKAWSVSHDTSYLNASLDALDYLLGRNATGYCFVTGFGMKSPKRPHHRPSGADGVGDPVPGFLVGGPNSSAPKQDGQTYANTTNPPKVYADVQASYASNEIAINWNAPLAFLAGVWSQQQVSAPSGIAIRTRASAASLRTSLAHGLLQVDFGGKVLASVELISLDGKRLARAEGAQAVQGLTVSGSGMRVVRAIAQDGSVATARLILP